MPSGTKYDAVVVGARCGGSPLAQRLAEAGRKVLLVDKRPPPADVISTHFMYPNTVARLKELGVLQRIEAKHQINPLRYRAQILDAEIVGGFTPIAGFDYTLGLTRPTLDLALLEAAVDAGAETRFGESVSGLVGAGTEEDPVAGVGLDSGEKIDARWVIGADGRASTVARLLGLEKRDALAGEFGILFAYMTGLPESDLLHLDAHEELMLTLGRCEDDIYLVAVSGLPEITSGGKAEREERFAEGIKQFPGTLDPAAAAGATRVSEVKAAPEKMMRGFFRQATGPGWALVGDAGHFKHPATAQGISDAIEQAVYVAGALAGAGESGGDELEGYENWRDERAAEHYAWSFDFGSFPKPEVANPIFGGMERDPQAAQDLRDCLSRLVEPRSGVFTKERLTRWFAEAAA